MEHDRRKIQAVGEIRRGEVLFERPISLFKATYHKLKWFDGVPCSICENTLRYVAGRNCVECTRQRSLSHKRKKIQTP